MGCFANSCRQMTSSVPPPLDDKITHMEILCKDPLPLPEGVRHASEESPEKQQVSASASPEGDRRQEMPGRLTDNDGGAFVSGEYSAVAVAVSSEPPQEEDCGKERLKRHRVAMAGRVWIPERWGQEKLLKDWVDCAAIDRGLVPNGLLPARQALVEEWRRANSGRFRIENRCLSS